ncbi:MAG: hypothetical protein IJD31_00905 [Lachnospiraceae bacterium]|nr:hypothetical protein [Lachnospiraceae bacterium]
MKTYLKKHCFDNVISIVLIGLSAIVITAVFGYSFSTNDDAMLRNIVSGNFTGIPEAHLIYIMYPLGLIWKGLYQIMPSIPWYDLFMVGIHYMCWFLLLKRVLQQYEKKKEKLLASVVALAILMIIDMAYLVMHQYTVLASVLAATAIFWLITGTSEVGREYWIDRIVCIVLLILCLWLRKQVFLMALPILFFVIVSDILKESNKTIRKQLLKHTCFWVAGIVIIVIISFIVEHIAYNNDSWQDFKRYNDARTDIYDFYGIPDYEKYDEEYEALGISYGDWIVIDRYDNGMVADLSTDKICEVASWSIADKKAAEQYYSVFRQGLYSVGNVLFYNDVQPIGLFLSVFYVVSLIFAYRKEDKIGFLCICGMLFFQAIFIAYFMLQGRFPERISYGLYLMQLCYLTGWFIKYSRSSGQLFSKGKFWSVVLIVLFLFVTAGLGLYQVRMILNETIDIKEKAEDWECVNTYFSEHNDNKYCIVTKSFVFSTEMMFAQENIEADNVIRLGSWIQSSPLENMHNERLGVSSIAESIVSEKDVYLIQSAENGLWWLEHYLEDNSENKKAEVIDEIRTPSGRKFSVIAIR